MNMIKNARAEISRYNKIRATKRDPAVVTEPAIVTDKNAVPTLDLADLQMLASAGLISTTTPQTAMYDGEKFFGGFGPTQLFITDYWELRAKSSQLFKENLYARGIIRRYVTNIINTGLSPESTPDESILGLAEDSLADWSEDVENRFHLWGTNPNVCDFKSEIVFAKIQQEALREALVSGDVLVVLRQNEKTNMPYVQLVNGSKVMSPGTNKLAKGHTVKHGVEKDKNGKHIAYWIRQKNGKSKRLKRFGSRGRLVSFLFYGTDRRMDDDRGEPLLSIILQSLKEIDRYRDSVQRKAVINSMLALVVTKKDDKTGTKPISNGAVRRDSVTVTDPDSSSRNYNLGTQIPGVVVDELQTGEDIKGFNSDGIDLDFAKFEDAIIHAVAWCLETPPEILKLAFSNNY